MKPDTGYIEVDLARYGRRAQQRLAEIEALSEQPPALAVPALKRLFRDEHGGVRHVAAEMLRTRFRNDGGRAFLLDMLDDTPESDREWSSLTAARILALEQHPRAMSVLAQGLRSSDSDVYPSAMAGLVFFGATAAHIFERELLDAANPPMCREMAAKALVDAVGAEAEPALRAAAADERRSVREAARAALETLAG